MSSCVSHGSPWVPRKASAPWCSTHGGAPFHQLVERAHGEADRDHEDAQPSARSQRRPPEQDLARHQRRDEALEEVPHPVVVVAGQPEHPLRPEAERHLGVSVVAAEEEHAGVDRDEHVDQVGEAEPPVGREEHRQRDEERRHLHPPGEPVLRPDAGHDQGYQVYPEQEEREAVLAAHARKSTPGVCCAGVPALDGLASWRSRRRGWQAPGRRRGRADETIGRPGARGAAGGVGGREGSLRHRAIHRAATLAAVELSGAGHAADPAVARQRCADLLFASEASRGSARTTRRQKLIAAPLGGLAPASTNAETSPDGWTAVTGGRPT